MSLVVLLVVPLVVPLDAPLAVLPQPAVPLPPLPLLACVSSPG